jgi:hypothetical protein
MATEAAANPRATADLRSTFCIAVLPHVRPQDCAFHKRESIVHVVSTKLDAEPLGSKFEFVINLKSAKTLGLDVPPMGTVRRAKGDASKPQLTDGFAQHRPRALQCKRRHDRRDNQIRPSRAGAEAGVHRWFVCRQPRRQRVRGAAEACVRGACAGLGHGHEPLGMAEKHPNLGELIMKLWTKNGAAVAVLVWAILTSSALADVNRVELNS